MKTTREPPADKDTPQISFGFRNVPEDEKASLVRDVFESVAPRYDLMNDLMSLGIHRLWKSALMDALIPRDGMTLLDVAGGTGDIAFRVLKSCKNAHVTVCDINPAMIEVGKKRALDRGLGPFSTTGTLDWVCGNAEDLPMPDSSVDAYTIAFGLRNVTRIEKALNEARRVLRPGGHFLCLEFSHVALPLLDKLYDLYSFNLVPALGRMVAGDEASYRYLVESIRRFPPQAELVSLIQKTGLERVSYRNLSGGIAALHSAWRI